jgi:DNA-binding IclR family transcriptional regulator
MESVYLGVFVDDQVLYLDKKIPEVTLLVERPIPTLSPVYCTAIGKVFMAFAGVPPPALMPALTRKTITDPQHLQEELRRAQQNGFASDDEELNIGVRCIAAPLVDSGDIVVGAISIAIPSVRIEPSEIDAMGLRVRQIARTFPRL